MDHLTKIVVQHPVSRDQPLDRVVGERIDLDPQLAALCADWHDTSERRVGIEIPLGLINRRSISESANVGGEVNYQYPMCVNGQWFLVIALEDVESPDPAIIGHEIMHWLLVGQGFLYVKPKNLFARTPATPLLNDLSHHVPLNHSMSKYGIDYCELQDRVTDEVVTRMDDGRFMKLDPSEEELLHFSFVAADLLLNCTPNTRPKLTSALESFPRVKDRTNEVLEILEKFDLYDTSENQKAQLTLIESFGMPSHVHVDNFDILRNRIA